MSTYYYQVKMQGCGFKDGSEIQKGGPLCFSAT